MERCRFLGVDRVSDESIWGEYQSPRAERLRRGELVVGNRELDREVRERKAGVAEFK